MAQEIGIRELKNKTSKIVRQVREEAAEYVITHHGRPVAILRPIAQTEIEELQKREAITAWNNLLELGETLTANRPSEKSALATLAEIREEES